MEPDFSKLDRAFNPQCIAVIGDKGQSDFNWIRSHSAFKGKLYSVQIDPNEIAGIEALGVTNYTSLMDIPEPIDLAIVAVPRAISVKVLEDCIHKEVAAAHFFTAGFSESNTEEGIKLERMLFEKSSQANFHLVGPNCMGIFNPEKGVGSGMFRYAGNTGHVALISQSGNHTVNLIKEAYNQGIDVNKAVSFGNGVMLDSTDYLEYFGQDPEIKVIGMYLEGVKDGRRFLQVLKEVCSRKPVVIWKGGRTNEGERAIASHTGSLAVPMAVFDAAVKQGGAIKTLKLEELIDTLKAILFLPSIPGNRVAVTGGSGGQSVAIADAMSEAGLELPMLTQESYDELATFFTLIGGGYLNPVDTGNQNRREMKQILEILERDKNVDSLILLVSARADAPPQIETHVNPLIDIKNKTTKPVMSIITLSYSSEEMELSKNTMQKLQGSGIPAFISLERGAFALRKALDYTNKRGL